MFRFIFKILIIFLILTNYSFSQVINKINIIGNDRISKQTIILFGDIKLNESYSPLKLNNVLKNLYKTNFFDDVTLEVKGQTLFINVKENPIVQSINFLGIKKKNIIEALQKQIKLKVKSSFVENIVKNDETILKNVLKSNGYYFSKVETLLKKNNNNTIDISFNIDLGKKAYISNIKFIGDKKIKDRKLKNVIISEESKFWKFISNRKFLDNKRIKIDENLLRNYYKNNGFYNVKVNSTFAQVINDNKFELVFNIDAGNKYYFKDLSLEIPSSFDSNNFVKIRNVLEDLVNEEYSLNSIKKILDQIDQTALKKEYQFLNATYTEILDGNNIKLIIKLNETDKIFVEKINIFGNNITNENVLRNLIITDEGDPYNDILFKKSINNLKSKNIFQKIDTKIKDGSTPQTKIIDIIVEEKATGEIAAGAGTGTGGSSLTFSIKENNYLGQGTKLNANATLSDDSIQGLFSVTNPNFRNTDKSLITSFESTKNDLMSKYGYETEKIGFSFGTLFEQYQDIYFSPTISTYFESLDTSTAASSSKKKQEGDYLDTNFSYSLTSNKLNQNFQPTAGYKGTFFQSLPIVADDNSIGNSFNISKYHKLENESIIAISFFAESINNFFDDDVRISKRVFIPSRKLRGFESGKIGPKDGDDFIGGNYGSAFNVSATLPNFLVDLQNIDFSLFFDSANVWGVDYNSSLDSNKIRSSTGFAVDWFTPIGPLSFSFTTPITKASSDKTEEFRFQLGTSF